MAKQMVHVERSGPTFGQAAGRTAPGAPVRATNTRTPIATPSTRFQQEQAAAQRQREAEDERQRPPFGGDPRPNESRAQQDERQRRWERWLKDQASRPLKERGSLSEALKAAMGVEDVAESEPPQNTMLRLAPRGWQSW